MIKKLTAIASLTLVTGCATYPGNPNLAQVGPYTVAPYEMVPQPLVGLAEDPGMYVVDRAGSMVGATLTQPINDTLVFADQVNQLIGGVMGPNNVSGAILTGQNYTRNGLAVLNNPWIGVSMLRNLWVK
jgi:hypothetical protein